MIGISIVLKESMITCCIGYCDAVALSVKNEGASECALDCFVIVLGESVLVEPTGDVRFADLSSTLG